MTSRKIDNSVLGFEKRISFIIFSLLFVALLIVTILFAIITYQIDIQEKIEVSRDIDSAISIYQYSLSEKMSIIASSVVFLDFYNSGDATRKNLEIKFLTELLPLRANGVIGYSLSNLDSGSYYETGKKTDHFITVKLCYLAERLDSENGKCYGLWRLYFTESDVIQNLLRINNLISPCKSCSIHSLSKNGYFGTFPVSNESNFNVRASIDVANNASFYYFLLTASLLIALSIFNRAKLHAAIKEKISHPLDKLIEAIKQHRPTCYNSKAINEINYLATEIEAGRRHSALINQYEKQAELGNIAASVAHDIRSPIAALEMGLYFLAEDVEEAKISILRSSLDGIRSVADNLIDKYRHSTITDCDMDSNNIFLTNPSETTIFDLNALIEDVVRLKKVEWFQLSCSLVYQINGNKGSTIVNANENMLKRVISNLLNNAIEACSSNAAITLILEVMDDFLVLSINDNGVGIPADKIRMVLSGESSKHAGKGLGLSGAKSYIESIGGQLEVISDIGEGTSIKLRFIRA